MMATVGTGGMISFKSLREGFAMGVLVEDWVSRAPVECGHVLTYSLTNCPMFGTQQNCLRRFRVLFAPMWPSWVNPIISACRDVGMTA